ncbi:Xaa-Pro aminopeptidase [Kocuria dechangensis]|uniref:Xaa-Pro aminopeptidase n=1 Tax=Kocuria dechangensis TaxID=1176249 RepID=A0A917LNV6_9MICC|nr:M24 family metallopeptidase [Kocuria dechangensis]GGG48392.1 Xaa-Pro aminopeptidase [Kocuria dechangensis]
MTTSAPCPEDPDVRPALFSPAEYGRRLRAVRERMAQQGLSALLVTDPSNLFYLTGYDAWSFYSPQLLFVPEDGEMLLFLREMDANGAFRTSWLPPEQIIGYPERYVQRPHLHPFDWVALDLRRRGRIAPAARGCVGLEMDAHFFSPKGYRALVNALPEWTLVDCFELVNWVRAVKSDAEIRCMRAAARVTTAAMQAAIDAVEPGTAQHLVAARIARAQAEGVGEAWGDFPAIVPLLPTGASADTPHLTWSDRVLREGDAVVVELSGAHRRYHAPLARTVLLGTPSDALLHLEEAVAAGLEAVLDTAAAGVPTRELAGAWNRTLAGYGLEKHSRLGYSVGIGYPPDWGERTVSIRSEDETVLAENMTLHVICGMWMTGVGYVASESIRVTGTGVEALTSFPRALIRK